MFLDESSCGDLDTVSLLNEGAMQRYTMIQQINERTKFANFLPAVKRRKQAEHVTTILPQDVTPNTGQGAARYTLRIYESRHWPLLLAVYDNHLNELPRSVRTRLQLRQSGAREVRVPGIPMFTALSGPSPPNCSATCSRAAG